jgi:Na+/alanine symporter
LQIECDTLLICVSSAFVIIIKYKYKDKG